MQHTRINVINLKPFLLFKENWDFMSQNKDKSWVSITILSFLMTVFLKLLSYASNLSIAITKAIANIFLHGLKQIF